MLRFLVIAVLLMFLVGPVASTVGGAIETGYEARDSNTRLVVAATRGGAEVVPASAYEAPGE